MKFTHQLHFLRCCRTRRQHGHVRRHIYDFLTVASGAAAGSQFRIRIHILQCGRFAKNRLKRQTYSVILIIILIYIFLFIL